MPYNRTKGRTSEIPPSPSAGRSRSMSSVTTAAAAANSLFDPRQVDAQLEAQLGTAQDPAHRCDGWRDWLIWWLLLLPLGLATRFLLRPAASLAAAIFDFVRETPAVIPAVLAMLFLYIALPLMIAWDLL